MSNDLLSGLSFQREVQLHEDDRVLEDLHHHGNPLAVQPSSPLGTGGGGSGGGGNLVQEIEVIQTGGVPEVHEEIFPVYKDWLAKHEEELEAKRKAEDQKLEKAREEARAIMKKLYTDRITKIEQNKIRNREIQEVTKQENNTNLSSGSEWSRIVNLVDTKAVQGGGEKDKSRMREVLIKLSYD